jgi:hypothetical protein
MVVNLIGNPNEFEILKITKNKQVVDDYSITKWNWKVTPLIKGEHELILSITYVYDDNEERTLETYTNIIYIYSNDTFFDKLKYVIFDNWKWFMSTLFIPLFIYYKKKKKNKKTFKY